MKWTIDSCTPSDGSKDRGITVDHRAWLKGEAEGQETIHVLLNISSRGVPEPKFKAVLDAMVAGLNAAQLR